MRMNKLLVCFAILLTSILVVSCDKDEDETYSLELEKESVTIDFTGGDESLALTASDTWKVQDVPDWIVVTPEHGDHTTQEIYIGVEKNEELEARSATLTFICGNINRKLEVEQLGLSESKPYLEITTTSSPSANADGGFFTVKITTNTPWKITESPQWVSVSRMSGDTSGEVSVRIPEHRVKNGRMGIIVFTARELTKTLEVTQHGLNDYLRSPGLSIFTYNRVSFTSMLDWYKIETHRMFINPGIKEKIYVGNLISHQADPHTDIPEFTGYTLHPVTVSTGATNVKSKTFVPSFKEQQGMAAEVMARNPEQSGWFRHDNGTTEFYDYKHLYAIGMVNLGIKLDELVSGASFTQQEMNRNFGMVYAFKNNLFSLDMDIPDKPLTQEPLSEADKAQGVSYVSAVHYGKVGVLVIESDIDSRNLKPVVDKLLKQDNYLLPDEERRWVEASDFTYVYFSNEGEVQTLKGNLNAILAYKDGIADTKENIYPIEFYLADAAGHFTSVINYTVKTP